MNERIYTYNGKPIQFNTKEKKFFVGNVWIKPREGFKTIEEAKHYIDSRAEKITGRERRLAAPNKYYIHS